ncbi:MAG: O-antigen ligase family protein [Clostridia bacterium]|nr:O-antigen ligase family protein [Clostridia bacterium]
MKKSDIIIKKIGLLILIATIVIFNFIIGANEKGLRVLPISILMGFIYVYLIIIKIKNKKESIFLKTKIDYLVLIFMLTTTLPLIFKTYVSYSDTVEFIMKYFFIYSVYILARNVLKDKKSIEIVITTILISSLVSIVLGFDYHNTKILKEFTKWLNVTYKNNKSFYGTFGYANAQAVYSALCVLLAMHKFKIHKNKVLKIIDILYILFVLYIIYITKSRAVMILLGITLFALLITRFRKQIIKHKKKTLIGVGSITFCIAIYLMVALNVSKPIIKDNEDVNEQIIYNFKKNETYTLEINMTTEVTKDNVSNRFFIIELIQYGQYFQESTILKEKAQLVNGYYSIDFTPTQDTRYVRLKIKNLFHGKITIDEFFINGKRQIVNYKYLPNNVAHFLSKFYIEGKSLPQRLYMYQDCLKIASDSPIVGSGGDAWRNVSRSVEDYKCALKESHSYFFELLISYGIVGVITFLSLVIYFFIKIFKQFKEDENKRNNKIFIALGLFIVILHCMIDFDMSFMLIQLLFYIFMAALLYDEQIIIKNKDKSKIKILNNFNTFVKKVKQITQSKKTHIILDYIVLIIFVFVLGLYIRADISEYLVQDTMAKYNVASYKKTYYYDKLIRDIDEGNDVSILLNEINNFMDKEVYHISSTNNYNNYFGIIINNIDQLSLEDLEKYFGIGLKRLKNIRFRTPLYFDSVIKRTKMFAIVINELQKYKTNNEDKMKIIQNATNELKQIANNEYEINIKNINDFERTGLDEENKQNYLTKIENAMSLIK